YGGEKLGFVDNAEEAFELAGEICVGAVFDQRRGSDRVPAGCSLRAPRVQQWRQDLRRDRLLIEFESDLDREPALLAHVGASEPCDQSVEPEMRDLVPIGISRECKPAGRRNASRS